MSLCRGGSSDITSSQAATVKGKYCLRPALLTPRSIPWNKQLSLSQLHRCSRYGCAVLKSVDVSTGDLQERAVIKLDQTSIAAAPKARISVCCLLAWLPGKPQSTSCACAGIRSHLCLVHLLLQSIINALLATCIKILLALLQQMYLELAPVSPKQASA